MPKFSIILPVRNGGDYLKECVRSILAQTVPDFDLLVLDNDSTDGTTEWIRSIADPRIKIYPSEKALVIEENWDRISKIPKNEFITLIGHDDRLNKDYLFTMQELIMNYPDAALYQTHFNYIDSKGEKIRDCKPMKLVETAKGFLEEFLSNNVDVMGTGFMMRSTDYDRLGGIPPYPNLLFADFALWISLTKISYKVTSPKQCFSFRLHQSMTAASADIKFQQAFERFIFFLEKLKNESREYRDIIRQKAADFLLFYCRGLSHRLLRTPKSMRGGLTVKGFIRKCKMYAAQLGLGNRFYPERFFSIRVAKMLDSNPIGRALFLAWKKLYPKPMLK